MARDGLIRVVALNEAMNSAHILRMQYFNLVDAFSGEKNSNLDSTGNLVDFPEFGHNEVGWTLD